MDIVKEAWDRAVDARKQQRMNAQLKEMKAQGYDTCKLCGERVSVHEHDIHEDVLRRLTEHANDADDHVHHSDEGWMLVSKTPKTGIARVGYLVWRRALITAGVVSIGLFAANYYLTVSERLLAIIFLVTVAPLAVVTVAGAVISWVYPDLNPEHLRREVPVE